MNKKEIYSFEQWCLDNNRQDLLERWDYELNSILPSYISYKSNKKYWFKCPQKIHDSQLQDIQYISSGRSKEMYCTKCRSFAQYIINNYGENYFNKIWSRDNTLDPWKIPYKSNKKAWFNCVNNETHKYEQSLYHYSEGIRCPFCTNQKILEENSLGYTSPEVLQIWSDKNIKSPYEYAPKSGKKVWWRCENGIHDDYQRTIANSENKNFRCPKCSKENAGKKRIVNLAGLEQGELKVIEYDEEKSNEMSHSYWKCSCSCGVIKSMSIDSLRNGVITCGDKTKHYSGEKSSNWKGGITPERLSARTSLAYNNWRDAVYAKDWYTCQCCGKSHRINKQAHHLYNFSGYEDLRYNVDFGITLCDECHYPTFAGSFHNTYGTQNNTPQQLEEYINNKRKELGINIPFSIDSYLNGEILKPNTKLDIYKPA